MMPAKGLDINIDFGEGFSVFPFPNQVWRVDMNKGGALVPKQFSIPDPEQLLKMVTSINLSCGFHAGDPLLLKRYAELAIQNGCNVGAHPSYPDREGFGNRYMELSSNEIKAMIQFQLGALEGLLSMFGASLHHVKCHGALYNRSSVDENLARDIVEGVSEYRSDLPLYLMPGSALEYVSERSGIQFYREGFADRAYESNGKLVDRRIPGAVLMEANEIADRVYRMVHSSEVEAVDGTLLHLKFDTICFHPDTPGVLDNLVRTREKLNVTIK